MIVTLSEQRLSNLLRQLEGLDGQTDYEIFERMPIFGARLFKQINEYGLKLVALLSERDKIADFRFAVETSDLAQITAGLQFMNPVCISVEQSDMAALVADPILRSTVQEAWPEYQAKLQRILPGELSSIITDLCWKAVGGRLGSSTPHTEQGYQEWLRQNGLTDPAAQTNAVEAYRQAEVEAQKAREAAAFERQWGFKQA